MLDVFMRVESFLIQLRRSIEKRACMRIDPHMCRLRCTSALFCFILVPCAPVNSQMITFEPPTYQAAALSPSPTSVLENRLFKGQDAWSYSVANGRGLILTTVTSGEYRGGYAAGAENALTYTGARPGGLLGSDVTEFQFDMKFGNGKEMAVGLWHDTDNDKAFDQLFGNGDSRNEFQMGFGIVAVGNVWQVGIRSAHFGTRIGSGVSLTEGHWYHYTVRIENTADSRKMIRVMVRNLTLGQDVLFAGSTSWNFLASAAQVGKESHTCNGVAMRITGATQSAFFDNIQIKVQKPVPKIASVSTKQLNFQTGMTEEVVNIYNDTGYATTFDLVITNLSQQVCVNNASSCENGVATIQHRIPLQPGAQVALTVEYITQRRGLSFSASYSIKWGEPVEFLRSTQEGVTVDRVIRMPNNHVLIEFPTTPGKNYVVQYSHDLVTWRDSPIVSKASGTRLQWIDSGLPKTEAIPSNVSSRYYRVIERP